MILQLYKTPEFKACELFSQKTVLKKYLHSLIFVLYSKHLPVQIAIETLEKGVKYAQNQQ